MGERCCRVYYGRSFGGRFAYVVHALALTIITSDNTMRTRIGGYRRALKPLVRHSLIDAARRAGAPTGTAFADHCTL